MLMPEQENPAVTKLREYLRIKTVHPTPDYGNCKEIFFQSFFQYLKPFEDLTLEHIFIELEIILCIIFTIFWMSFIINIYI